MTEDHRRRYPVIANMLASGAQPGDIPSLMGLSPEDWNEIQDDPLFQQVIDEAKPEATAPMTPEEVLRESMSMTRGAFDTLQSIIDDPRATAAARLQAASKAFEWREELQKKRSEADARVIYHLHIDRKATVRMQDMINMFMSDEGKRWMREQREIMPNSTA